MTILEELMSLLAEENIRIDTESRSFEGDFQRFYEGWVEITSERRVQRTFIRADRIIAVTILAKAT